MTRADAYAAYLDDDGKARMWPSSVLFVDLLGVSAMSRDDAAPDLLRRLRPALEAAVQRAGTEHPDFTQASTWFTDNAVVGAPLLDVERSESVVGGLEVTAAYLLLGVWSEGFLGRGAITFGPHYMDDRFVFGPALIDAVALEKAAKWPRVVVDETTIELDRLHSEYYADPLRSAQSSCLTRDEHDVVFVDHLGIYIDEEDDPASLDHFLGKFKKATTDGLAAHPEGSPTWLKWRWLADYQNHALASRLTDPEPHMVQVSEVRHQFADFLDPSWGTRPGSPWYWMDRQSRYSSSDILFVEITTEAGAYAVYREGERVYVGEAVNLDTRIRKNHLSRSLSLLNSSLRRNVAEHLGFASAADIKSKRVILTADQVAALNDWLADCEYAWMVCADKSAARDLERELLADMVPFLNRT